MEDKTNINPNTDNKNFKDWYIEQKKKEYVKNKIKNYYSDLSKRQILAKKFRLKAKEDIIYRILNNLSVRTNNSLSDRKLNYKLSHKDLIGCDLETLKKYLESKFTDKMTWENYGLWELDHIIPIASFNLKDFENVKKCFHYTNLQPLWAYENRRKSDKLNYETKEIDIDKINEIKSSAIHSSKKYNKTKILMDDFDFID